MAEKIPTSLSPGSLLRIMEQSWLAEKQKSAHLPSLLFGVVGSVHSVI